MKDFNAIFHLISLIVMALCSQLQILVTLCGTLSTAIKYSIFYHLRIVLIVWWVG
jgi:hypothetical protein